MNEELIKRAEKVVTLRTAPPHLMGLIAELLKELKTANNELEDMRQSYKRATTCR